MTSGEIDLGTTISNGGGGGGGVSSLNTLAGALTLAAGSGISVNTAASTITISSAPITGQANAFAGFDNSGNLTSFGAITLDTFSGGMDINLTEQPNNLGGGNGNNTNISFDPLQNSPDDSWTLNSNQAFFDINSSGFNQGTNGNAVTINDNNIIHHGTGNVGDVALNTNSFDLGNGVDPITVRGISYSYGFGSINDHVTISNTVQGYGFQPTFQTGSVMNGYMQSFYDTTNCLVPIQSYTSFSSSPSISSITPGNNVDGVNISARITTLDSGTGYTGVGVFPVVTTINSGSNFNGIAVSPAVTLNKAHITGIDVNMNNVTNYTGAAASLVVQDITYTFNNKGADANNITVQYLNTTTAGNEIASLIGGLNIQVSIQSGVSTASQVHTALQANSAIATNLSTIITGVGSNPQVTYAQTHLAGGIDPGTARAASFAGDVSIDGSLSFTGALSIGRLTSYAPLNVTNLTSGVNSVDQLITAPSIDANAVVSGADLLAINTAMLLNIGDNANVTSSFLGYAALGLPAVLAMGAGSIIDRVAGAVFAISLDSNATGGVAQEVALCRALALPNGGVTTVDRLIGYKMDLPFGNVGTDIWGLYVEPAAAHNFMAGDLIVGDSNIPINSSVALEINSTTKAFLPSRMNTTQRDALSAVAGMVIWNTSLSKLQVHNGATWETITSA